MRALRGSLLAHNQRLPLFSQLCGPNRRISPVPLRGHLSSVPERTRKLPSAGKAWRLKPWQRNFLAGILIGAVLTPVWIYYDDRKRKGGFEHYRLVKKEPVSSTASIFYLEPENKSAKLDVYKKAWQDGIWNLEFKQPQIQVVRAYTPLSPMHGVDGVEGALRFLIRREHEGEVSNYIHSLPVGSNVELRGPNVEYRVPKDVQQVLFVAGGTGIAPALQVAHAMFDHPVYPIPRLGGSGKRKLHILWANRRREDCVGGGTRTSTVEPATATAGGILNSIFQWAKPDGTPSPTLVVQEVHRTSPIVDELEALVAAHPGQISVQYFVNDEDTWINARALDEALAMFDDLERDSMYAYMERETRQIIISGPSGFITHIAGPKQWRRGREEQGEVSHLLAHALWKNPHNVKVWKV